MINKDIVDYIKAQIGKGQNKEDIKKALAFAGWQQTDIVEAFRYAEHNIPVAVPVPNSFQSAQINQNTAILASPTDLLKEAWGIYKARFLTFAGIILVPFVGIIILMIASATILIGSGFFRTYIPERSFTSGISPLLIIIFIIFFITIILLQLCGQAAMLFAVKDSEENIGVKESYRRGWHKVGSIFWVGLLSGIIVMGGYLLLVIPGIIFGIWFSLATMVVIAEGLVGMNALLKSKTYVTGYWWEVFWRFLFIGLVLVGINLIFGIPAGIINFIAKLSHSGALSGLGAILNFIGNIVSFLLTPLSVIYTFLVYKNLKAIKGEVKSEFSSSEKIKFIIVGIFGVLLFIGLLTISFLLNSSGLGGRQNKAMDIRRQSDIDYLQIQLGLYAGDHDNLYPSSLNQIAPKYTIFIMDPKTKLPYEYRQLKGGKDFELCANLESGTKKCINAY